MSIKSSILPLWTDLNRFRLIADSSTKSALRRKYKLPEDKFIISHMGHLNIGRNLHSLIPLQSKEVQIVVVSSTSTPKDALGPEDIRTDLEKNGIIILDHYIDDIAEIYQLSDVYIFPVKAINSSIGMPLSILEARACGIKVLTTDFGSIKSFMGDDFGNIFYSEPENFAEELKKLRESSSNPEQSNVYSLNQEFLNTVYQAIDVKRYTN